MMFGIDKSAWIVHDISGENNQLFVDFRIINLVQKKILNCININ